MASPNRNGTPLELRFAACRSMGHEWHHESPIGSDDSNTLNERGWRAPFGGSFGMVGFPSTCSGCGTERMRWISRSGESLMRYQHPDGYERHGDERLTATEWRKTYVASVFESFVDPYIKQPAKARAS